MYKTSENYDRLTFRLGLFLAAPHTWPSSFFPSLFGALYGYLYIPAFSLWKSVLLILTCILFNSAANVFNDYFDFIKGTDSASDNVEVNDSVLVYNNLNPAVVRALGFGFIAAGGVCGCIGAIGAGYIPFVIGLIGVAALYGYSGGKTPICYLPLGEITSGFVMGGLIPAGVLSCFDGRFHAEILLYGIPFILSVGLTNMSNHGCDIEKDIKANRKTLPILLTRPRTLVLYRTLLVVWMVSAAVVSGLLAGMAGLIACLVFLAAGLPFILRFMKLRLEPVTRIRQLKGILQCSFFICGSVNLALLVRIITEHIG